MTGTELPSWTDYTVSVGTEYAAYLENSLAVHLGGLRIMDLGDGRAALDDEAVTRLLREPEDSDGCIEQGDGGLVMWIDCSPYPVNPATETATKETTT
jgi:hypothetical protein